MIGYDIIMIGVGYGYAGISIVMTLGIPGMIGGGLFYLVDETIGWQEVGRRQYEVIQNNPNWWRVYSH